MESGSEPGLALSFRVSSSTVPGPVISSTWELVRHKFLGPPQPYWIRNSESGPRNLSVNKSSRRSEQVLYPRTAALRWQEVFKGVSPCYHSAFPFSNHGNLSWGGTQLAPLGLVSLPCSLKNEELQSMAGAGGVTREGCGQTGSWEWVTFCQMVLTAKALSQEYYPAAPQERPTNQMSFCRDWMKREATWETGLGRRGVCVWGTNRRCCLQSQLFGVFRSWPHEHRVWQPRPAPLPLASQNSPWGQLPSSLPPFYRSSPLCVTRRSKAEAYFLFFLFFKIKRVSSPA